ncbi:MAG: aminotransferase class V-fold PLP-dependent enzyme [Oscillospiraceae bacterium]|jgi:cysteine desulfurase family protein
MIYFDNAATTFPKPVQVKDALSLAITKFGGNPGRGGHEISMRTAEKIFSVRNSAAELFGAKTENIVFTLNCTHALNFAIKGIMNGSGHIITSSLEHNSVIRPIHTMALTSPVTYDIAQVSQFNDITVRSFESLIKPNTKAIACTVASNVTGQLLPYREIGALCKKYGICFIADGAQACGAIPLKLSDGINILCAAGHKGLYGPTGTGLLVTDGRFELSSIIEGGTGATTIELTQTPELPEKLESGTVNTVGIIALGAGIDFLNNKGISKLHNYEAMLCNYFINGIRNIKNIVVYRIGSLDYVPLVAFNIKGLHSQELTELLDKAGFALRGGLHCTGLAHKSLGTLETGTARFAPGAFNTKLQVEALIKALKKIGNL